MSALTWNKFTVEVKTETVFAAGMYNFLFPVFHNT